MVSQLEAVMLATVSTRSTCHHGMATGYCWKGAIGKREDMKAGWRTADGRRAAHELKAQTSIVRLTSSEWAQSTLV